MHTILHIVGYLHHPSARPLPAVPAVPLVSLRRNVWQAGKQTQGGGKVFGKVLFNGNLRRPEMIEHQLLLLFGAKVHQGMWRWHCSGILGEAGHQAAQHQARQEEPVPRANACSYWGKSGVPA